MKTLPESPNLDHLRRQAKDLLSQLRLTRPETSLSDAQGALAEMYGCRDWPELKAEVERRKAAVEAAPEWTKAVTNVFGLGDTISPMQARRHGGMSKEWSLTTSRGKWVVAELFDWADSRYQMAGLELMEAAGGAGLPVPRAVRSPSGQVIEEIEGKRWRVYEWAELGPEPIKPVPADTARLVGQTLATLHGLGIRSQLPIHPWLTARPSAEQLSAQLTRSRAANLPWTPLLEDALPALLDLLDIRDPDPATVSLIVCHCDLHQGSVRLDHRGLAVVDWEYAGPMSPRWELGSALMQWCLGHGEHSFDRSGSVNVPAVHALVDGYRSGGGVIEQPDMGMFAVGVTGALNYVSSRINWATPHGHDRPVEQQRAEQELPTLLRNPVSRDGLERILEEIR